MFMMIFASFVFLSIIGVMVFAVLKVLKQTDPNRADTSVLDDITTAQEFLPFEDIRDGMIVLGGHQYRAVIECSSINYNLRTDKEKEMIEVSFQRFLNSLTFPITMFVQTRVIDNTKFLLNMEKELHEVVKDHPQLQEYANRYFQEMGNLHSYIGNNKQKKKYIIVPYENIESLERLVDGEIYEHCMKELHTRTLMIIDGLASIGINARRLTTAEIAELILSTYHKDNYSHVENVVNGEFLTLLTSGENNYEETISDDARLDWILYEAQLRIQNELIREDVPDFMRRIYEKSIKEIDQLRDSTSGYYKQRFDQPIDASGLSDDLSDDFQLEVKKNIFNEKKEAV